MIQQTLFDSTYRTETLRLPERDYSQPGSYFITICTSLFLSCLGQVNNGEVILSSYGKIVKQEIYNLQNNEIEIDACVIMPNHIHIIISIKENYAWGNPMPSRTVETSIYGVSEATLNLQGHAMNRVSTGKGGITGGKNIMFNKQTIGYFIRQLKGKTAYLIRKQYPSFGWQSNYYEHVIRDERDFGRIYTYIMNNPLKRKNDEYYI